MTPHSEEGGAHVASGKRQRWWTAVVVAALLLGVGIGWLYARSDGFQLTSRREFIDCAVKLTFVLAMTLQSGEIVRSGREKQFWYASIGMMPAVYITCRRALASSPGWLAFIVALTVAALWFALSFACDRRRRRMALWCICLCGGLATSTLLWTWNHVRTVPLSYR